MSFYIFLFLVLVFISFVLVSKNPQPDCQKKCWLCMSLHNMDMLDFDLPPSIFDDQSK